VESDIRHQLGFMSAGRINLNPYRRPYRGDSALVNTICMDDGDVWGGEAFPNEIVPQRLPGSL